MLKQTKVDQVNDLVSRLEKRKNFILTSYAGIKVKGLSELRKRLRQKSGVRSAHKNKDRVKSAD